MYYSWNFECNTLRLVNFYNTMIFTNQTMDDLTRDYFSSDEYNCIENINQILYSYYLIGKKRKKISKIYKTYDYFTNYTCKSLYDYLNSITDSSFAKTIEIMKEKYNHEPEALKESFTKECLSTQSFIGNSVSPAFQSLYKKVTDAMILFDDRTYEGIIDRLFSSGLKKISSMFLNVTRYIIYIVGKITFIRQVIKLFIY